MTDTPLTLPEWDAMLDSIRPVGNQLINRWGRTAPSVDDRRDLFRLALSGVANGYLSHIALDPRHPTWTPCWNIAMNMGGPCPDYTYRTTDVDPQGSYRISGFRGTNRFVEVGQHSYELLGHEGPSSVAPLQHSLDDLTLGEAGAYSVILSPERPAGYTGDWWRLAPTTVRLLLRQCSVDWIGEVDARIAIERLDDAPPTTAAEIDRRIGNLGRWAEGMVRFDIDLARWYREHHGINVLTRSKKIESIGGMPNQVYYDGAYEIEDDEALVIETALPRTCLYWSLLVADDRFSTIDWANRQSSLNEAQARLDNDGKLRVVISKQDPGVQNWMDKADNPWGIIQMRWKVPSDAPDPVVTRCKVADVRQYLPSGTPAYSAEERAEAIRKRRIGYQMRTHW
ncbi:hypothetical protein MB02_11645 [Croceicoccus estronivorus]|uniref:DUF1214 domain-containing protein n=1 Tax=Croceicoccus estronivorus TaxID=1172626 RepID=UPI000835195B|nr:DUF1214 domain-containing protein [Croceicoccus estronivorus]OCC23288.1 hypothetical protein MB02_11645 [Croceicoccus estronivorus]